MASTAVRADSATKTAAACAAGGADHHCIVASDAANRSAYGYPAASRNGRPTAASRVFGSPARRFGRWCSGWTRWRIAWWISWRARRRRYRQSFRWQRNDPERDDAIKQSAIRRGDKLWRLHADAFFSRRRSYVAKRWLSVFLYDRLWSTRTACDFVHDQ